MGFHSVEAAGGKRACSGKSCTLFGAFWESKHACMFGVYLMRPPLQKEPLATSQQHSCAGRGKKVGAAFSAFNGRLSLVYFNLYESVVLATIWAAQ